MHELKEKYALPDEILTYVDDGFLEVLAEDEEKKTIEFHIPSKRFVDDEGRIAAYSVIWIHPNFNEQFCHYYLERPGDLPNFYVHKSNSERGDEPVPDLENIDDMADWLDRMKRAVFLHD